MPKYVVTSAVFDPRESDPVLMHPGDSVELSEEDAEKLVTFGRLRRDDLADAPKRKKRGKGAAAVEGEVPGNVDELIKPPDDGGEDDE